MGVTGAALGTRTVWRAVRRRTLFWLRAAAECVIRGTEGRRPRGTQTNILASGASFIAFKPRELLE